MNDDETRVSAYGTKKNAAYKYFILILAAAVFAAAFFLLLWRRGAFLPGWIEWKETVLECGGTDVVISLENRRLEFFCGGEAVWSTPPEYQVQDFQWDDIDSDGKPELLLLCWRIGTYGEHRPFWVEENDERWSQHIFIYDWDGREISPLWMASDLGMEVRDWKYDEHGYLILLDRQERLSGWAWLSWGLERVDTDVTFAAVGDVLIHAPIYRRGLEQGSFDFLYENVSDVIREADIAVMNQETVYTAEPSRYSDFPKFGTPLSAGEAVVSAGFNVVTAATNHALDQGMEGIDTTYHFYGENDILALGIQPSEDAAVSVPYQIVRKRRISFALLNYTYGLNGQPLPDGCPYAVHRFTDEAAVREDIRAAREAADIVIVFAHWGTEYQTAPDEEQRRWTQVFLEEGVDVAVGTHPHVLQPYEWVTREDGHRMLVYYSLGNFVSAQDTPERILGGMAQFRVSVTLNGCAVVEAGLAPVVTHQADGVYTAYLLEDYTEELAGRHRLGITLEELREIAGRAIGR